MKASTSRLKTTLGFPVLLMAVALGAAAAGGCGGKAPATPPPPPGAVFAACAMMNSADSYAAGMTKTGKDSKLTVKLMSSDPGPPIKGTNAWTITIQDAAGNAVEGATIGVLPFMPAHNHGTQVKAVATALPDGGYSIAPLYFYMAGTWETTLDVVAADKSVSDSIVFSFCVDG